MLKTSLCRRANSKKLDVRFFRCGNVGKETGIVVEMRDMRHELGDKSGTVVKEELRCQRIIAIQT